MSHQDSDPLLFGQSSLVLMVFYISLPLISSHTTFFLSYCVPATLHFPTSNTSTNTEFCLRAFVLAVHLAWNALVRILRMSPTSQASSSAVTSSKRPFLTALLKVDSALKNTPLHPPSLHLSFFEMILFVSLLTNLSLP